MVADRATHTFSPQRRSRCRWGSIVVPEPRLLLFPALALLAGPDYPAAYTPPTAGALPSQRRLPPALTALSATGAAAARVAWSRADGDEVRCAAAGTRAIAGAPAQTTRG